MTALWSGSNNRDGKVRLNRGGNRTINTALHMIAVNQIRGIGPGKDYVARLQASGKTSTEAVRLLRRRPSDAVFAALRADAHCAQVGQTLPAAAPAPGLPTAA